MSSTKTKKVKNVNEKTLIVTVDIGKEVHHGYFRSPNNKEIMPFPFCNDGYSFKKFWGKICQFQRKQGLEDIVIGFESTGPYAEPLFHYLRKKPVKLVQVNPMHSKRLKELTGNSPNKTDKKDPRVIADVISLGHALTLVVPEGAAAELRRLAHARERALKSRTAMSNQLQHIVFVIFPEFLSVMKNISTKSALYLLKNHPASENIVALGIESVCTILKKVSRGQLGTKRAEKLLKAAQNSVGIDEGKQSILLEIAHLVSHIESLGQFIDNLEKQMEVYLEQIPYSHSLLSIKGISIVTVGGLIGEVGDFKQFNTISEITKLAGLDLYEVSSGKHKGQRRISKRGRSLMRKLLYLASVNMVRYNGIMHDQYQRMLDRGMLKGKALVAISRKLLRLIFALAHNNTVYIGNYSEKHKYKYVA